jgi:S1-C subfamily serine protease
MSEQLFIRLGKQTRGPFDHAQLQRMMKLGQFGRMHEVSEDRAQWRSAGALIDQWAPAVSNGRTAKEQPAMEPSTGSVAPASPGWYYHVAGAQVGPKTVDEVRAAIAARAIKRNALIWREGLADWTPADRFPEFFTSGGTATNRGPLLLALSFLVLSTGAFGVAAWQKGWFDGIFKPAVTIRTEEGKPVALLSLPENATPAQVTSAYRERVYYVHLQVDGWKLPFFGKDVAIAGAKGMGSAVALSHDGRTSLIATNRHVICPDFTDVAKALKMANLEKEYFQQQVFKGGRSIRVKQPDWLEPRNAQIAAVHRERDLAVVLLQLEGVAPFSTRVIDRNRLVQAEGAVAIGNPKGLEFFTTNGVISSTRGQHEQEGRSLEGFVWTNCSISSGNSGGPLLLARRGHLVGLNTLGFRPEAGGRIMQNLNAAEPLDEAVKSLADKRNDQWYFNPTLKELTSSLAKLVPVVEK